MRYKLSQIAIFIIYVMVQKVLDSNKVVNLVFFGPISEFNSIPQVLDYGHRNITEVVPCRVVSGKYLELRTGQPVKKEGNVQEWPILTGAALQYEGENNLFLLSRRYDNRKLMLIEIMPSQFHPETMHKILIRKRKKTK